MAVPVKAIAKLASAVLTDEDARRKLGWVLAILLSPLILLIATLAALATGGAEHNNQTIPACFYGAEYSEEAPAEFRDYITEMQRAFSLLDSAVGSANNLMEDGNSLDPVWVKAVFLSLYFGDDAPSRRAADRFVKCFYGTEERIRLVEVEDEEGNITMEEETYTAAVPYWPDTVYANLSYRLGQEITEDDRSNAQYIYTMIVGSMGGSTYDGTYTAGGYRNTELDTESFTSPTTKNNHDLVAYAIHAWESGWGYVWGTFGSVLTDSLFYSKLQQYPEGVGTHADFIASHWLGGRVTDCVGLIKGYGWLDGESGEIVYGSNGMPDISANQMYYSASVSGPIETMPDIPGLAVWHDGHIGVYIGNGEVIEAMGTMYGVVKTQLEGRGWSHWLQIEYIQYN